MRWSRRSSGALPPRTADDPGRAVTRAANILLSLLWVLWGWVFSDPNALVRTYPVDFTQYAFVVVVGLVTPLLGCWFYSRKDPGHAPWPRPGLGMPLATLLRRGQPGWIFVLAWCFFLAGVSCSLFGLVRGTPLTGFHLVYLLTGIALLTGALAALRRFGSEFRAASRY